MDPFVRRLVERMLDPKRPLSRNRHFHTFATPEGKAALKASRRLRSLQADILACRAEGHPAKFLRVQLEEGEHRVELLMERIGGRRTSILEADEFALLVGLPGVREAIDASGAAVVLSVPS